jgi:hypothetical protein
MKFRVIWVHLRPKRRQKNSYIWETIFRLKLAAAYRDAAKELNITDWDCTIADGLSDETW